MADYDAVIIGSGNNGLACALYLARAGWRVLVLEQALEIGGAVRSGEVTLPGFKHDLFATNFTAFTGSPVYADFRDELDKAGVHFLSSNFPFASVFDNAKAARVYRNEEMTEREIACFSNEDLAAWREICRLFKDTSSDFLPLHVTPLPSIAMFRRLGRILRGRPSDAYSLAQLILQSSRQFVDRRFTSTEMKGLFTPWAFHLDYGPDVRGGAMFCFIAAMSAHVRGLNVVEGGAGRLMAAMRNLIEKYGGQVITGTCVKSIETKSGCAVAVTTADGSISAGKAVIANVTPRRLFGGLLPADQLPPQFYRRISKFRYAVGTFVLHLALSDKLRWKAAENLSDFNYVHVEGTTAAIETAYNQAISGYLPARPMLVVSQPSSVDASRSPAGRYIARIHARAFPTLIRGDAADVIRATDWDAIKDAVADRLLAILAEYAPNIRSVLLSKHAVSPADLEQQNPNLIDGDCNGGSHHLSQNYFLRPALGWTRYQTPIRQLYMIGASQWPGSGVNAASGYLLAQQLLS
jgi:phytoene dehydrogenase-like protein